MAISKPTSEAAPLDAVDNFEKSRQAVGYVPRSEATEDTYQKLGFKCGLEIHQQLLTEKKLFCHCPAGIYQAGDDFDAELVRHMRPTLSELGEYDGTALMEFRTRKNIVYRIKDETACTYDIDDTPPFLINLQALEISIFIALMLKTNIVGEFHITRKQYLDGSIPTGFQRTGIVGIEGEIPISNKKVRIIQISLEEDSCREVSDIGHWRTYTTDRLGMPLIETVTYPDMLTPDEAAEAAQYLRFLARASGKVRTGIGAAREDVNVSVTGGTRVEIKGVQHIKWIPELTHNEAFRQWALLQIRDQLVQRVSNPKDWKISHVELEPEGVFGSLIEQPDGSLTDQKIVAVNLPHFAGLLSYFTGPERTFAHEISDRLKVIACLEKPNMVCSEDIIMVLDDLEWDEVREKLCAETQDAQLIFWGPEDDVEMALVTIEERCQAAFDGVPNETRKSMSDGTTIFERVLPGPDRMYPDTDSAPIPIEADTIERLRTEIPVDVSDRMEQLKDWKVPSDTHFYLLRNNLVPVIERVAEATKFDPKFIATLLGHTVKSEEGRMSPEFEWSTDGLLRLFRDVQERDLATDILAEVIPAWLENQDASTEKLLDKIGYRAASLDEIRDILTRKRKEFSLNRGSETPAAEIRWLMGQARPIALGNIPLAELRQMVESEVGNG